ncbi:MAG: porin [bacterium]
MNKKFIIGICLLFLLFSFSKAEDHNSLNLSKGLNIIADDSSFAMKFGLLLQPRFEIYDSLNNCNCQGTQITANSMLRRMRFRFDGFLLSPKLTYAFQLGVTNNDMNATKGSEGEFSSLIYDAYFDWEFVDKTKLRIGQAKLPGCLSRLMSFGGLNFLERSYVESQFNTYRDVGLQILNQWSIGDFTVRENLAWSHGEGVNQKSILDGGYAYSGRIEFYPFGLFVKAGETYEMDLSMEKTPKLLIGASAFYDDKAHRERGILGKSLYQSKDITQYFADFLFKYRGFAAMGEYYYRNAQDPITTNSTGAERYVLNGQGYGGQVSYMISDDMALGLRYNYLKPDDELISKIGNRTDYSLGFTKFIFNNKVKLQADINYFEQKQYEKEAQEMLFFRINAIFSI